ncbi:helix-turn-helix transcriptional regulator [Pseudonocardia aurantiaca]|uniref:Helix-turn-helix domain-containing protein n=1 Tax=Pseudonocardia aurantiaca TaxID=75290 RepID=A0ABW4FM24_9PSEU
MADNDLARTIGERVQFYRTASRRAKTVVAGLTGITPDYLYQIERGQKIPTVAVLTQLADVLGVPAGELLCGQPARNPARGKTAAGGAIYQALTSRSQSRDAPVALPALQRRVREAWTTWQTSPHRYSQLTERLPALIADIEHAVRTVSASGQTDMQREHLGCAADLYGLLRTVTKRIGRVDLSLLAADRAVRCAEAAGDPLRLAAAHWNMSQVLLADGEPQAAEAVAMRAAERMEPLMAGGTADMAAMYGSVILLGAVAAARNGDAWTARDRIRRAAPLAKLTGERNTMWTAFGPTNVAMYAVSIEFESGEAVEGLRLAERVDHDRSPSIERRVAFLVDQAKGYEQRRDFASALTLLTTAEREAPEDMQYRPAAHAVLRTVAHRGRRHVAAEASQLALRIGLPV